MTKKNRNHNGVVGTPSSQSSQSSSPRITITSDNAIVGDLSTSTSASRSPQSSSLSSSHIMMPQQQSPSISRHVNNRNLTSSMAMPSSTSNHNNNTNNNISIKEKADFNARLEQRRRQRRDQRLQREHRKDNIHHRHTLGRGRKGLFRGFKTKHFIVFTCSFLIILFGWIVGFYFLIVSSSSQDLDGSKSSPFQMLLKQSNRGKILKDIKDTASSKFKSLEDTASSKFKSLVQKKKKTTTTTENG